MSEDTVEISDESAAKAAAEAAGEQENAGENQDATAEAPAEGDERVAGLQRELEQTKERLLRQMAEYQNYRRRTEQEKMTLVQAGKEKVLSQMLEVFDDFSRSIAAVEQTNEGDEASNLDKLRQGVQLVHQKFSDALTRLGVEPIEAVGQKFDEHLHEAMLQQPGADDMEPGTVIEEIQKGYRMGDKVLRHSRVVVAA